MSSPFQITYISSECRFRLAFDYILTRTEAYPESYVTRKYTVINEVTRLKLANSARTLTFTSAEMREKLTTI